MINFPICNISGMSSYKFCIHQSCEYPAFVCKYCQENQCQNIHDHNGKQQFVKCISLQNLIKDNQSDYNQQLKQTINMFEKEIEKIICTMKILLNVYVQRIKKYNEISIRRPIDEIKKQIQACNIDNANGKTLKLFYQNLLSGSHKNNKDTFKKIQIEQTYWMQNLLDYIKYRTSQYINQVEQNPLWSTQDNQKLKQFHKQLRLDPRNLQTYINRGLLYYKNKQYQKALLNFTKLTQIDSKNPQAYYFKALVYQSLNQLNLAQIQYNKAISCNHHFAKAYYNRGLLYKQKTQIQKALLDFTKAIQYNKDLYCAYNSRGLIYEIMDKYQQALEDYCRAIQINKQYSYAYYNRGLLYMEIGFLENSLLDINKYLQYNINDIQAQKLRQKILHKSRFGQIFL